jgi:LPXTG-site transpeptidase (sortase) family protein
VARLRTALALGLVLVGSIALAYPVLAYNLNGDRGRRLTAAVELALARSSAASGERDRGPTTSREARSLGHGIGGGPSGRQADEASGGSPDDSGGSADADASGHGSERASDDAPVGGRPILEVPAPRNGQALGIVQIPSISLRTVFLEGVSESSLMVGPGHLPWTSMPGTGGVSVIAAHRDLHFADLHEVDYGDRIWLQLSSGTTIYKVVDVEVTTPGDGAIYAADPRHPSVLRLLTCWPPSFAGPAPDRLVVTAAPLQGDVAPPAPSPAPVLVPHPAEQVRGAMALGRVAGRDRSPDRSGARTAERVVLPSAPDAGMTEVLPMIGAAGVGMSALAAFAGVQGRRRRGWFLLFVAGALVVDAVLAVGLMA